MASRTSGEVGVLPRASTESSPWRPEAGMVRQVQGSGKDWRNPHANGTSLAWEAGGSPPGASRGRVCPFHAKRGNKTGRDRKSSTSQGWASEHLWLTESSGEQRGT